MQTFRNPFSIHSNADVALYITGSKKDVRYTETSDHYRRKRKTKANMPEIMQVL